MTKPERILVIRLGALGDLVLRFQAFHEIRQTHPNAEIALLTAPAFADFARSMPWFDRVLIDPRPSRWRPDQWLNFVRQIREFNPTRVYDLQGKLRQTILFMLLGGPWGPEWSGAASFCSHPRLWPPKPDMHFMDFIAAQLRLAGVPQAAPVDLSWLDAPDNFHLPEHYAVLVPGCSPGLPHKRWPAESYGTLAQKLHEKGIIPVIVGTKQDADAIAIIKNISPQAIDLCDQTTLPQLAGLLRRSAFVIGNDTGPAHLAAVLGTPVLFLLSAHTNPIWSASRNPQDGWLKADPLSKIIPADVFAKITALWPSKLLK